MDGFVKMNLKVSKKIPVILVLLFTTQLLFSQALTREERRVVGTFLEDSSYDVQTIELTREYIIGVYGGNGCRMGNTLPEGLEDKLYELNAEGAMISDIHISEDGSWVLVGDMVSGSGIPQECGNALNIVLDAGDHVTCVSFNALGDWCVIGEKIYMASSKVEDYIKEASSLYGHIKYVHITNDAVVVSCETGQFCSVGWDVPLAKNLSDRLDSLDFRPKCIKLFYDGSFFIGNQDVSRWTANF